MRRLSILAASLLFLSWIPAPAQRGGVRGGFGGHGGAVGRSSSWGHSFGGTRAGAPIHFSGGGSGFRHFHDDGFRRCWGCRWGYGYPWYGGYGYGAYYPYWWWDSYSSYDYDEERDREIADRENTLNLEQQNLRERENWLGDREEQDVYAPRSRKPAGARSKPDTPTVLVYRDQHRQEISNYAIAGGTLWVLSEDSARKISLADLDLDATVKANEERGVEFQVPK